MTIALTPNKDLVVSSLLRDRDAFESRYGHRAGAFLTHLPSLFRLFKRLTFDLSQPAAIRQRAALLVVYIAEQQDFLGEATLGGEGLIDDVWVAYRFLAELCEQIPADKLLEHWRSAHSLEDVVALARNVDVLREQVPWAVLKRVEAYMATTDTISQH